MVKPENRNMSRRKNRFHKLQCDKGLFVVKSLAASCQIAAQLTLLNECFTCTGHSTSLWVTLCHRVSSGSCDSATLPTLTSASASLSCYSALQGFSVKEGCAIVFVFCSGAAISENVLLIELLLLLLMS